MPTTTVPTLPTEAELEAAFEALDAAQSPWLKLSNRVKAVLEAGRQAIDDGQAPDVVVGYEDIGRLYVAATRALSYLDETRRYVEQIREGGEGLDEVRSYTADAEHEEPDAEDA